MPIELDLLLLGTGTSSSIPLIQCLTDPDTGCHCCRSTLPSYLDAQERTDEEREMGRRNKRRNTSGMLRIKQEGGGEKTVLIDCGKTFLSGAHEHWPAKGLREIDAVILTHAHADAILGLDDLRGWTLRGAIQPSIPIYLTQETFTEVSKAFPYLTNAGKATGGGDIPALTWEIFDENKPFEVCGIEVVPLPVHHGKFFTSPPAPYFCLGFLFASQICYLSDVSYIPQAVWEKLSSRVSFASSLPLSSATAAGLENSTKELTLAEKGEAKPRLQALVIDCLRLEPFTSHFGLGQAMATARKLGAEKNYLIGFGHRTSHALWLRACLALSAPTSSLPALPPLSPPSTTPIPPFAFPYEPYSGSPDPTGEDAEVFVTCARRCVEEWGRWAGMDEGGRAGAEEEEEKGGKEEEGVWVRPSRDGMTISTGRDGARDDEYGDE